MIKETKLQTKGLFYAISAFTLWGLVPIYFKALTVVSEFEVLSHRVVWSFIFLLFYLQYKKLWPQLFSHSIKSLIPYLFSAALVSCNWFLFIWAVGQDQILETSLGYFINPLVSVCLGMIFLGEKLRPWQGVAVLCAVVGVLNQLIQVGSLPWVALLLAFSFAGYGLVRKVYPINSLVGLFVETGFMLPFALLYFAWLWSAGELVFLSQSFYLDLLLLAAGLVTSIPLLLFASGTYFLSLKVMGMVQYITPTLSFLLAVWVYDETFELNKLITFVCIWLGLFIFTFEGIKNARQTKF